ncbi:MAG: c-type cytochrome [Nannocystaceae bacterium]
MILSSLVLTGCQDDIDLDPLDNSAPVEARVRPSPILGGTLTLSGDGGLAIASDPDRDLIHVVDLSTNKVRHTVALADGDRPHRVIFGSEGQVHVVLRGPGELATLDPVAGTVTARVPLCPEPRGIALDPGDASLYAACAGGSLLHLSETGELLERFELEPDLRDVLIVDGKVMVSLFRSASLLGLDGTRVVIPSINDSVPHVAWRTWVTPDGEIAMLHQLASTQPVPIDPEPGEIPEESAPYGGGGGGCELGIVNAAITTIAYGEVTTTPLVDSNLTVDAAFSPDGGWVAMAVPGALPLEEQADTSKKKDRGRDTRFDDFDLFGGDLLRQTVRVDPKHDPGCFPMVTEDDYGQVTAVAFAADGRLIMQSREPARLMVRDDATGGALTTIALEGEARFDTGHEIFHRATKSGLSCASCHPEGTDDGHVWDFEGLGPRRTQAIDVGLRDTAPYHWDGDMPDFDVLMSEVLAHRMGGKRQSPDRSDSFTRWIFDQERPAAHSGVDALATIENGKALFTAYECSKCHDGAALGGTRTERIAGEEKQVPTLRRISLHPPYMHDGRSKTLEAAVRDMIETTRSTSAPDVDVDAIAAYLRTL